MGCHGVGEPPSGGVSDHCERSTTQVLAYGFPVHCVDQIEGSGKGFAVTEARV
jgi:hypothetical protein